MQQALDPLFNSFFKPNEPGGAVLVVKNNIVVYQQGFGIADTVTKERITPKTLFNIGSVTKTFVAYGILILAKENKLSLDDDLCRHFPDFKNNAIAKRVRIHHLLTHTSGLPDSRKIKEERNFYLTAKDAENFAPLLQTESLEFEPGEKYHYSNPVFNGLALIIEKVTGRKWQDYIHDRIFRPSGMKASTITDGPHPESGVSHGYIWNAKNELEELDYGEEPTFAAAGNGGVWSNVQELWKYEQAIQQAVFLDAEWIKKSRTVCSFPNWKEKETPRLGFSWFLTKEAGLDMIGHSGSQGGFISDYFWLPEKRIFYVFLCNIPTPIRDARQKLFEFLTQNNWLD